MQGNELKLCNLRDEMKVKSLNSDISDYFKGCYTRLAGAVEIMLRQGYNEEQLEHQAQHFRGNMSTLQMVINAFKGDIEDDEPNEIIYEQMTLF